MESGLYLCATPIGNLGDITLRVLETLKNCDVIACEDTRVTEKLLRHYEIKKPTISYHEHNAVSRREDMLALLAQGKAVALVSDAGLPGISDPGSDILREAVEAGYHVEVLPGANAGLTGLVLSTFPTQKFIFEGFLPSRGNQRTLEIRRVIKNPVTTILYEAPHRVVRFLEEVAPLWDQREMALARELTKKFEEVLRGTPEELLAHFETHPPKGEFVIILPPYEEADDDGELDIRALLQSALDEGLSPKEAVKKVAQEHGLKRNDVYKESLEMKKNG